MIYALICMGIALAVAMGVAKIEHSGKLEAQAQVEAREATIRQQNAAVEALGAESARKTVEGAAALRKAEGRAKDVDGPGATPSSRPDKPQAYGRDPLYILDKPI